MKNNQSMYNIYFMILLFGFAASYWGCGDFNMAPNTNTDMNISLKSDNGAFNDPGNIIVIEDAKALIEEVEVEKDGTGENEDIKNGPFVIHFKTDGSIQPFADASIQNGKFTKLKFQIHKPEDNENPPDPDFKEGSSSNLRYSIIITGTINGTHFIYKSKQSADIVISLDNTINLQSAGKNITLILISSSWFIFNNNSMDPRDPNNENNIDNNLHNSFKRAFEDNDKNGVPDGH